MTRRPPRAWAAPCLVLVLGSSRVAAVAAPEAAGTAAPAVPVSPVAAPAPRSELRQALSDFFVHALVEDLGLTPAEAVTVQPLIRKIMEAQRGASRDRNRALRDVWELSSATSPDPAAVSRAVAAFDVSDRAGATAVASAREALVKRLEPLQAARFLAFEGRFRERVRELVARSRAEAPPGAPSGRGEQGARPFGRRGGMGRERPPRFGPAAEPGDRPPRNGSPVRQDPIDDGRTGLETDPDARRDGLIDTLELVVAHRLRQELPLSQEETLALLPELDRFMATLGSVADDRGRAMRQLREVSSGGPAGAPDEKGLRDLVSGFVALERDAPERLAKARRGVMVQLDPVRAGRFLVLEQRLEREAPRRLRAHSMNAAPGEGPPRPPLR